MTTDCTRCGAATADQVLTYVGKMRREDRRNVQATALCPACYTRWFEMETRAAVSLERHPGPPGRGAV